MNIHIFARTQAYNARQYSAALIKPGITVALFVQQWARVGY